MLDPKFCKIRQSRLVSKMQQLQVDAVVLSQLHHVYYFTGHLANWRHCPTLILRADGRSTLITANHAANCDTADEVLAYPANLHSTLRNDQPQVVGKMLVGVLGQTSRIGFDSSAISAQLQLQNPSTYVCIDPTLWQLRRAKDDDELALIKVAIEASRKMYERAKLIIEPGIPEIKVFNELHAVAVETTGEPMTALLGNDFACGVGGGPARNHRLAQAGELYILDLGPTYRGYYADNSRVFAVSRQLTDAQQKAYEFITAVFPMVEQLARPGVRCQDIFNTVNDYYLSKTNKPLAHHLGHGTGLEAHEFPHLNPNWDDTLQEGDLFTVEPGIYAENLKGGLRIENQYRVTQTGVENLTPFPMEMA